MALTLLKGNKPTWHDEAKTLLDGMVTPSIGDAEILILIVGEDGTPELRHTMPTMMAVFYLEQARLLLQGVKLDATDAYEVGR